MKVKWFSTVLIVMLLAVAMVPATTVGADKPIKDVSPKHDTPNYNHGVAVPLDRADIKNANPPLGPAKIGDTKTWLGLDDYRGFITLKNYTLRAVGTHVEVWVATNLDFPNTKMLNPLTSDPTDYFTYDDCRNDGVRNVITDDQVAYLIDQFDNNMYPIESDWWSVPPKRDGNKTTLAKQLGFPKSYYRGEGDNVVVLVDNVRDSNFYDQDNAHTNSYIAGFFYSVFDNYFDRTVMSIDGWDWLHRTGGDPPHNPTTDPCTSAPARPNLYEGTFAHEYQHLLHHYTDPDEPSWSNEGLSDFTEVITGYAHLDRHVDEKGYDSHTQAFLGWLSVFNSDWNPIPYDSGPENGLTAWGDQGDGEILADYGNAMFFMNYLYSQPGLGKDFFHAWQHNQANGIDGLNATLADFGSSLTFADLFANNEVSALVDGYLDNGASLSGGAAADFQNSATEATVNFTPEANGTHGAPPWGSDYIDLGPGAGLSSVVFNGDDTYIFPGGPEWILDTDGYFTNPDATDNLYGDNQDLSIARNVSGNDGAILSFDHYYETEPLWDYGFVQVSTDGGATWQSLACDGTTSEHDPGAISSIVANMPGYTGAAGSAGAPVHVTCPALPAGTTHLAFRLMTDPAVEFDGWHVKNIQLNGVPFGTDLTGWDNEKFFSPLALNFDFALVGINGTVDKFGDVTVGTGVQVFRPTLGAGNEYTLTADDLAALSGYDKIVAIVSGIPASEDSTLYQPYSLLVNETERADGQ